MISIVYAGWFLRLRWCQQELIVLQFSTKMLRQKDLTSMLLDIHCIFVRPTRTSLVWLETTRHRIAWRISSYSPCISNGILVVKINRTIFCPRRSLNAQTPELAHKLCCFQLSGKITARAGVKNEYIYQGLHTLNAQTPRTHSIKSCAFLSHFSSALREKSIPFFTERCTPSGSLSVVSNFLDFNVSLSLLLTKWWMMCSSHRTK